MSLMLIFKLLFNIGIDTNRSGTELFLFPLNYKYDVHAPPPPLNIHLLI